MKIDLKVVAAAIVALGVVLLPHRAQAQADPFDLAAYKQFLADHQDLSTSQLLEMHPAGIFDEHIAPYNPPILYLDSIELKLGLTEHEKSLLLKHGFVVTERLSKQSMGHALLDIYHEDLPVFISTDAILHALHRSYDRILMSVELDLLIPRLDELLAKLHGALPALQARYASNPSMLQMLKDVDLYLTIPRKLLNDSVSASYSENTTAVSQLMTLIEAEQPANYPLFSSVNRIIDFSQFTVRGHYNDEYRPILGKYFKAMMWLGRTEVYLLPPQSVDAPPIPPADIQRQIVDAVLMLEAAEHSGALPLLDEIDAVIEFFVGESDNVTLHHIEQLLAATAITSASQLLDTNAVHLFQDTLKTKAFTFQRILSQILYANPFDPDSITPASAFLLLGQRFIIDSYITGQVVYDRIRYNDIEVRRMLPSTLDVLFALGNDAAAQLLQTELDRYHYGTNLAAVRYLVDHYDTDFWNSSLFNIWLSAIRTLNPPAYRDTFPPFMQTAAWWQEKMNTQLASWAELRHDNLLYAKQSYTGLPVCSFPFSYVEPYPEFYRTVNAFAQIAHDKFETLTFSNPYVKRSMLRYFETLGEITDTLGMIAEKELAGVSLSLSETTFLKSMLRRVTNCVPTYDGWFPELLYNGETDENRLKQKDLVVADVHTSPADEFGNPVGWVLHVGTGEINLGVVIANVPGGQTTAFVGPMMSYHEYLTTDFLRLTDEEWSNSYLMTSTRPSWVNLYLADTSGGSKGEGLQLLTSIMDQPSPGTLPQRVALHPDYPNPFNASTIISFTIPPSMNHVDVELTVYTVQGQEVKRLLKGTLPSGNYVSRWDGTNERGAAMPSGVYFYRLKSLVGDETKKLVLVR